MILTIFCIVFLMAVALFFIKEAAFQANLCKSALEQAQCAINQWRDSLEKWEKDQKELHKWKRPRGKNGRFTK